MNIFQINKAIEEAIDKAIDVETGEILDFSELEELQLAKEEKIKNTALYVLNLRAEAEALEKQEKKFKERKQIVQNKEKRLLGYLDYGLNGQPFNSTEVNISFRKSKSVGVTDNEAFERWLKRHKEFITATEIKPDKTVLKKAIESGIKVNGCVIIEKQNMQIK